jgi:hypothetical protein
MRDGVDIRCALQHDGRSVMDSLECLHPLVEDRDSTDRHH